VLSFLYDDSSLLFGLDMAKSVAENADGFSLLHFGWASLLVTFLVIFLLFLLGIELLYSKLLEGPRAHAWGPPPTNPAISTRAACSMSLCVIPILGISMYLKWPFQGGLYVYKGCYVDDLCFLSN